jgi:sodium-dependent dicarboxylate transporter 2/3/5
MRTIQKSWLYTASHVLLDTLHHSLPDRRYLNLLVVLILGLFGYWLGPKDLPLGAYSAQIDLSHNGHSLSATYPFELGNQAGQPIAISQSDGLYKLIVEGEDTYEYKLGQSISFQAQLLDADREPIYLPLEDISSTISGTGYSQVLPPTDHSDEWLIFSLRIPYKAKIATALLFAVATLWLTELVPLAAGSLLIPVVIVVASIADAGTVLQPFFHPIVVLFLAGFLLAEAMRRTGVDRVIALNILRRSSLKPAYLMLTMMGLTAFLSMWMSNTASVAIIIPIALAILEKIPGDIGRSGFRRALILGVAYAATIGGIGSAIGTPANILAITFLNEFADAHLGFIDWFYYGLPIVVVMVPVIWLYLILIFRVRFHHVGSHLNHEVYEADLKKMGGLSRDQRILLLVFVVVMGLWLTDRWHHLHTAIVALGGVLVLFFTETIKKEDLNHINWNALLTFGGGLALGTMLVLTGVSDWIALQLTGLVTLPPILVVLFIAGLTLLIGAFISNTACAAMLIPLAIPLAQILHMDPRLLVAVVAIASSIDFALVVGTPPTMMAYSTGFFEARDIFKRGIILDLIGILVLSFGIIWIWQLLGAASL